MNDREIIEHWALRDAFIVWFIVTMGCLGAAILCSLMGYFFDAAMYLPAVCAVVATLLSQWRMRRLWKRIVHLEGFVRR